jgi:hypothetical protein
VGRNADDKITVERILASSNAAMTADWFPEETDDPLYADRTQPNSSIGRM